MSIDWITVAAQIANFLILVWLLKRFLYRPILDGIDAHEAEIAARMQEAAQDTARAEAVRADFYEQTRVLQAVQAELTAITRAAAESEREALLAEARAQIGRDHAAWRAHRDKQARDYAARLHGAGAGALLSLTRKALADLADITLEDQMARSLENSLRHRADDLRHAAGMPADAVVTSLADLPPATRTRLSKSLAEIFPGAQIRFETDPAQSPGLVVRAGGAEISWTTDAYIDGMQDLIEERLAAGDGPPHPVHNA